MAFQTQGLLGGLESGRGVLNQWKSGQNREDLERQDREVRLDPERALRSVRFFFSFLI